jgi:hypothetical protein
VGVGYRWRKPFRDPVGRRMEHLYVNTACRE